MCLRRPKEHIEQLGLTPTLHRKAAALQQKSFEKKKDASRVFKNLDSLFIESIVKEDHWTFDETSEEVSKKEVVAKRIRKEEEKKEWEKKQMTSLMVMNGQWETDNGWTQQR